MSGRYWIAVAAIGLALTCPASGQDNQSDRDVPETDAQPNSGVPDEAGRSEFQAISPDGSILPTGGVEPSIASREVAQEEGGTDEIDEGNHGDLQQQRRMAEAAERMNDLTREQVQYAQFAFAASVIAVLVALGALFVSWSMGRKQTRAYISADPQGFAEDEGHPDRIKFGIEIRNSGRTPAHISGIEITGASTSGIDGLRLSELGAPVSRGHEFTLGADGTHFFYAHFPKPDPSTLKHIQEREAFFIIGGKVFYRDVFGRRRKTTFFFSITGDLQDPHFIRRMETDNSAT